jgi:glycosyltransferase involved in cell wall biosynthesis
MTEKPCQPLEILVVTNLAAGGSRTGSEVRSWYSINALDSLGNVTVLSLTDRSREGTGQSAWRNGYLRTAQESVKAQRRRGGRGWAWLSLISVLLMPWRQGWTFWMQHVVQYSGEAGSSSESTSRRLLRAIFRWQHEVFSRLGWPAPTACCGLIQVWRQMRERFLRAESGRRFDVLWVENTICWPVAREILSELRCPPNRVVLNGQNIEYQVLEQAVSSCKCPVRREFLRRETVLMRQLEIEAFGRSDLVIQCSDRDVHEAIKLVPSMLGWVFPNGVDGSVFVHQPDEARQRVPTVLFPASFQYGPNVEGARFLACEVWPSVLLELPEARLVLAGYDAASLRSCSWLADESIELVSSPQDMKPIIGRAWIVAVPLLSGGGTRLKILEAMSSSRAVVSTSLGAEGVPYEAGRDLLLADDAASFAAAIIRLLRDRGLRTLLEQNATTFVRSGYDWSSLGESMRQRVVALCAERKEA